MAQIVLANLTDTNVVYGNTSAPGTTGSANAQVVTYPVPVVSIATGNFLLFSPGFANTASATLTIKGTGTSLGPFTLKQFGANLNSGALQVGDVALVVYDGTNLQLVATSAPLTNPAGGDLAGNYPNPTVGNVSNAAFITGGTLPAARLGGMSAITNSLGGNVNLSNTGQYFDGPSVAQGTSGTWFASGTVTVQDTAGAAAISAKLWDGTTVIASTIVNTSGASIKASIPLSGFITTPAGNIRISANDATSTSGIMSNNSSNNGKDSTVTAIRIG